MHNRSSFINILTRNCKSIYLISTFHTFFRRNLFLHWNKPIWWWYFTIEWVSTFISYFGHEVYSQSVFPFGNHVLKKWTPLIDILYFISNTIFLHKRSFCVKNVLFFRITMIWTNTFDDVITLQFSCPTNCQLFLLQK